MVRFNQLPQMVLELLYPAHANCMGCKSPLGADVEWLCEDCAGMLRPTLLLGENTCPVCGRFSAPSIRCRHCVDWPDDGVSRVCSAYAYAPPVSGMIRKMKYTGVYRMALWMAEQMEAAYAHGACGVPDAVVPVPMHKKRQRLRGFNHAELLAGEFCNLTGYPYIKPLVRVRNTKQQARLDAQKRHENLLDAFRVRGEVAGMRILLVDDVLTTGATANQCAKVLRQAGAIDVQLVTLAATH